MSKKVEVSFDKQTTHIFMVLDRSGSMFSIRNDAIGGFNQFLKEQKEEPGEASFGLILFNHQAKVIETKPVSEAQELDDESYKPHGGTALLDAIGRAVQEADKLDSDKVIIAILTDGYENSSTDYSYDQITRLIKDRTDKGWAFLFLGADQDAIANAAKVGIQAQFTASYAGTSIGTRSAYDAISHSVTSYRSGEDSTIKKDEVDASP